MDTAQLGTGRCCCSVLPSERDTPYKQPFQVFVGVFSIHFCPVKNESDLEKGGDWHHIFLKVHVQDRDGFNLNGGGRGSATGTSCPCTSCLLTKMILDQCITASSSLASKYLKACGPVHPKNIKETKN